MKCLWKVVKKGSRTSVWAEGVYCKTYYKGAVVVAPENSLGILCFRTREQAREFKTRHPAMNLDIIKVLPLSPVYKVNRVAKMADPVGLKSFYSSQKTVGMWKGFRGTVGCKVVKVME